MEPSFAHHMNSAKRSTTSDSGAMEAEGISAPGPAKSQMDAQRPAPPSNPLPSARTSASSKQYMYSDAKSVLAEMLTPVEKMTDDQVQIQWRKEHDVCQKSDCQKGNEVITVSSASGVPQEVKQCTYQPIAGDTYHKGGSACRLTDEYMLQGSHEKPTNYWVTMQMKLLNIKTRKYREGCSTWPSWDWTNYRCRRRIDHIIRAARFISKAGKGPAFDRLNANQKKEVQIAAQDARRNLASVIFRGKNSAKKRMLLERLVQNSAADKRSFQIDPKASIGRTMSLIEEDLLPDDADMSVAERKIDEIAANAKPKQPKDDLAAAKQMQEIQAEITAHADAFDETMDASVVQMEVQADELQAQVTKTNKLDASSLKRRNATFLEVDAHSNGTQANSSSLEVAANMKRFQTVKWFGFAVVSVLTVISIMYVGGTFMLGMIAYVGLAALGCGAKMWSQEIFGHHRGKVGYAATKGGKQENRWGVFTYAAVWGSCVASFVSAPFRFAWWLVNKRQKKPKGTTVRSKEHQYSRYDLHRVQQF